MRRCPTAPIITSETAALTAKNNRYLQHPQNQAIQGENAIKEEFEKLRLFLLEEEKNRLKVVRQERDVKTHVMSEKLKNIEAQIHTLSSTISDAEAALTETDLPFLQVTWFQYVS